MLIDIGFDKMENWNGNGATQIIKSILYMCKRGKKSNTCHLYVLIPQKVPLISETSLESYVHDRYV